MARNRKLTTKYAGFPMFKVGTSGDTFPVTSPFTTGFTGLDNDELSLDLQFAADKTLTARKGPTPVFTRGSTGRFVGSDGLIQSAAINAPRFDHDPVTGVCKGLLIEESRTNLTWPSIYTTANSGVGIFPAGSITITLNQPSIGTDANGAALVRETATTQVHGSYVSAPAPTQPVTISSGTVYTASIFVKADGRTKCRFSFNTGGNIDGIFATFDLSSNGSIITNSTTYGTGASAAGISATIIKHIDGWFRLSVSGSLSSTTSYVTVETLNDAGNRSFLGDITKGVYIANAQLEPGSFPTSYIPTTTASVVRSADVCSITGSAFSGFYNQPEGTLFADVTPQTVDQLSVAVGVNTSASIRSHFIYKINSAINAAGKRWAAQTVNDAGAQTAIPTSTDVAISRARLAYGYKLNDFAFAYAGVIVGTDNLGTLPSPTAMRIGARDDGLYINGHIASVRYYKKRLSNAKLQTITV